MRCKVVCGDWSTYSFLLDVADTGGKKKSLEKADQLAQCLQNFAKDNDRVLQVIKDTLISFVADGERCEPLSARMCKDHLFCFVLLVARTQCMLRHHAQ